MAIDMRQHLPVDLALVNIERHEYQDMPDMICEDTGKPAQSLSCYHRQMGYLGPCAIRKCKTGDSIMRRMGEEPLTDEERETAKAQIKASVKTSKIPYGTRGVCHCGAYYYASKGHGECALCRGKRDLNHPDPQVRMEARRRVHGAMQTKKRREGKT